MEAHPVSRLGISACLLGQAVRYDGGHKRDPFLVETLGRWVEWVPVCPEVELGLGVPRPTLRLEGEPERPRLLVKGSGEDLTAKMQKWSERRVGTLAGEDLDGYVLKSRSPSCGMERVKVYEQSGGRPSPKGVGVFARTLAERLPLLPLEEEGRLHDPGLRELFIERVFAYRRLRELRAGRPRARDVVAFHTRHKMTLLAHHPETYRALGKLVAKAGGGPIGPLLDAYGEGFMKALSYRATRRKHTNVLQHLLGYLKRAVDAADRAELAGVIDRYRLGLVPLVVPLTLLEHHFRRHPVDWVMEQTYLHPYPSELMLRNHV